MSPEPPTNPRDPAAQRTATKGWCPSSPFVVVPSACLPVDAGEPPCCAGSMRVSGITHRSEMDGAGGGRRVGAYFVTPDAPSRVVSALEKGVRLTCVDAAKLHGLWVPLHKGEHVFRPRQGATRRDVPTQDGDVVFHGPCLRSWPGTDPVPDLGLVLHHAARCLTTVDAAILIESALNAGVLMRSDLQSLLGGLPAKKRDSLARVRSDAESGTETAVRWWLESRLVSVCPQAWIPEVGRVDLLVGNSWVIECDSRRFHTAAENYHADRARDLRLRARGYTVTRLTWEQVFLAWEQTEEFLLTILRTRQHRRPVTPYSS